MNYNSLYKSFHDRYLNKIEIGYRLPADLTLEETWKKIFAERRERAEILPLLDERGENFWLYNTKPLQGKLHQIDGRGKDSMYALIRKEIENELVFDSLIDEAWASNVIEGAFTTHQRAKEMVRRNLTPRDKNELMVKNNHLAMLHLLEHRDADFNLDFILEIHRIITQDTIENPEYSGRFRDTEVYIMDKAQNVIFKPMPAEIIRPNLDNLVRWVNADQEEDFIHPVVRASIIHFYMVYVHPFSDGNGRTARALFYYYLLKNRYEFFKYFSISAIIAERRDKYYKAIKDVEDYDNDLTYFLLFSSDIVLKSIDEITDKIIKKYQTKIISGKLGEMSIYLNKRQDKLIKSCIEQDIKNITTRKFEKIFKVSYVTARSDLNELVYHGLFKKQKVGKNFIFSADLKAFLT